MSLDIADLELDLGTVRHRGLQIDAVGVGHSVAGGRRILDDISLTIRPGQLVAIAGGSGAGKSTLLDILAGLRHASAGRVEYGDMTEADAGELSQTALGYVPQDDIIHRDLPLRATLRYAAQLRLPAETSRLEIDALVDETVGTLGLEDRADVRVGKLSGGQRKRASIGVELLTRPRALFLDEPTSGLDPATAYGLMRTLRQLADKGTTVVLTTHSTDDLRQCDRVVFLARGGRLAFDGSLDAAGRHFQVDDIAQIYEQLARSGAFGPAFYGWLIGDGTSRTGLFVGYLVGAGIMVVGGVVELLLGIKAEGKSLENITKPLTATATPPQAAAAAAG